MASPRRQGREVALQILCAADTEPRMPAAAALSAYDNHFASVDLEEPTGGVAKPVLDRTFAESLVRATLENRDTVDRHISEISRSWRLDRMARVDRNILRLGVAEMLYFPDIPARVTLNEAVELAKRYGAEDSPSFVNALLDSVVKSLNLTK